MSPSPTIRRNPSRRHTSTLQAGKASENITYGPDGSLIKGMYGRGGWREQRRDLCYIVVWDSEYHVYVQ